MKFFNLRGKDADELVWDGPLVSLTTVTDFSHVLGPDAKTLGTLTEPREFNLMFKTIAGALGGEEDAVFLRPETAQGMFVNFKNVCDSTRVRIPFGIAQMGKSFRNEITPRNFTFRSREFEQMEIEFFCHPSQSPEWYRYWRDRRYQWYVNLGLASERLRLRDHDKEELSHYSVRHGRHRIRLPVPVARRVRRVGGRGPSRRFRPSQPRRGQARAPGRPTRRGTRRRRQAAASRQRQRPQLLRRSDEGAIHSRT